MFCVAVALLLVSTPDSLVWYHGSMNAVIHFDVSGEEFLDNGAAAVALVLRSVSNDVMRGETTGKVYDSENNVIGSWEIPLSAV